MFPWFPSVNSDYTLCEGYVFSLFASLAQDFLYGFMPKKAVSGQVIGPITFIAGCRSVGLLHLILRWSCSRCLFHSYGLVFRIARAHASTSEMSTLSMTCVTFVLGTRGCSVRGLASFGNSWKRDCTSDRLVLSFTVLLWICAGIRPLWINWCIVSSISFPLLQFRIRPLWRRKFVPRRGLTVSTTTTAHVYERRTSGIPMTTTVSPKHSIFLPFAANLTSVGFRRRWRWHYFVS